MQRYAKQSLIVTMLCILLSPAAHAAVDGCALALCLAKGGPAVKECRPILKQFYKDTVWGKPPPQCKKSGGGPSAGASAQNQQQANQATNTAAVATDGTGNNAYAGTSASGKYVGAQTVSTTAVANATADVKNGIRAVDASSVLQSDNGQKALAQSTDVIGQANATVGDPGGSGNATATASAADLAAAKASVPSDIADEAQAELDAANQPSTTPDIAQKIAQACGASADPQSECVLREKTALGVMP